MRTTITLADDLFQEAKALSGEGSLSDFIRSALSEYVERIKSERLALEMADGYRAEANRPSLDSDWSTLEVEGL